MCVVIGFNGLAYPNLESSLVIYKYRSPRKVVLQRNKNLKMKRLVQPARDCDATQIMGAAFSGQMPKPTVRLRGGRSLVTRPSADQSPRQKLRCPA